MDIMKMIYDVYAWFEISYVFYVFCEFVVMICNGMGFFIMFK